MRSMLNAVRWSAMLAGVAMVAAGSALSGCADATGCGDRRARIPVRWGNDFDWAELTNYHRMGYDCVTDGQIHDELGRGIGQWWVCTRCG